MSLALLALLALTALAGFGAYFVLRDALANFGFGKHEEIEIDLEDEDGGELVQTFNDGRTWRPL